LSNKISIDIGSKNLHIAEGDFQKGVLTVKGGQSFELPPGCIAAEAIEDAALLAETLANYLKAGEFTAKEASLTINATHAIIRELDFPKAKPKELDSMIKNEMYQTFHVLNTDVIQYKAIGQTADSEGTLLDRYRVAAIEHDNIDLFHNLLERAGLKPVAMDINVNAIDKMTQWADSINEKAIDDKTVMLIDFGHSVTTIYICTKNQPMFYRNLNMGSAEIDTVLKSTFYMDEADAVEFKKNTDFFANTTEAVPYFEALKPFLYHMNDEIRKLMAFYTNRNKEGGVSSCFVFGQGVEMKGLINYWESTLNLPTEIIQSLSRTGSMVRIKHPALINAVAALIRYQE
jgi:type IV pilus assembly protein PilM